MFGIETASSRQAAFGPEAPLYLFVVVGRFAAPRGVHQCLRFNDIPSNLQCDGFLSTAYTSRREYQSLQSAARHPPTSKVSAPTA